MRDDQAMGLRRLFALRGPMLLGVVGRGSSDVVAGLAHACRRDHRSVFVLDGSRGEVVRALGVRARYDLLQVLHGHRHWETALARSADGIHLLAASRAFNALREHGDVANAAWHRQRGLLGAYDVVLANGDCPPHEGRVQWLLCVAPTAASVTSAYAALKDLARRHHVRACDVFVEKATTDRAALDAFRSVATTARRFLGIELALCGAVVTEDSADDPRRLAKLRTAGCERLLQALASAAQAPRQAVNH